MCVGSYDLVGFSKINDHQSGIIITGAPPFHIDFPKQGY